MQRNNNETAGAKHMSNNILITGVSRGLGLSMCHEFDRIGCRIAGCARNVDAVTQLSRDLPGHFFRVVDVADMDQVDQWATDLDAEGFVPDLLLNNAAIINQNANLWEVPVDEFNKMIQVNIFGSFAILRAFLPKMIHHGSGGIVNFSSTWGRSTSPQVAPYCATKYAIEGLTQSLASELPENVFAVALNPGIINTEMLQTCFGESAAAYQNADEWAKTAVPFLLSLGPTDNGRSLTVS